MRKRRGRLNDSEKLVLAGLSGVGLLWVASAAKSNALGDNAQNAGIGGAAGNLVGSLIGIPGLGQIGGIIGSLFGPPPSNYGVYIEINGDGSLSGQAGQYDPQTAAYASSIENAWQQIVSVLHSQGYTINMGTMPGIVVVIGQRDPTWIGGLLPGQSFGQGTHGTGKLATIGAVGDPRGALSGLLQWLEQKGFISPPLSSATAPGVMPVSTTAPVAPSSASAASGSGVTSPVAGASNNSPVEASLLGGVASFPMLYIVGIGGILLALAVAKNVK